MVLEEKRSSGSGFTMVEVTIVAILMLLVMVVAASMLSQSQDAFNSGVVESELNKNGFWFMEQMARELRDARKGELIITSNPPGISFKKLIGFDITKTPAEINGPLITYRFEYAQREIADDLDNNDNGLIDEGHIIHQIENGPKAILLGDEKTFLRRFFV